MENVPDNLSFPAEEGKILAYWESIDAFKESLRRSEGRKPYTFYDGPPFATGLPHYGHILAGTIKDIVTRYAHQTGHYVERRFGWDCHGLPIEFEIEQQLGIKTKDDVLKFGIENYNRECRSIVMRFSSEWRKTVTRMGRWIDFDNDYKTMNTPYMESVWWVFRQLFDKGLVYRGFKVMPYSVGCTTPLSNFEANMNYKDVSDPAVVVSFPVVGHAQKAALVAWTTTPWTLPSNLALCVNPEMDYVTVRDEATKNVYIIMEARLTELFPPPKKEKDAAATKYTILEKHKGSQLVGLRYEPLFNYFGARYGSRAFRVVADSYVTAESGTGIVHQAPTYGEDDFRVCLANGVVLAGEALPDPVNESGFFIEPATDFKGMFMKDADKAIQAHLKANGRLVSAGSIVHSYPFCWRSEAPLIYRAVPSFFVAVEKIKEKLLANNEQTYWVPSFVKEKRFHNWLQDARDWSVSRNRYWGTPLPVWASDDFEEIVCVGSIAELAKLSGLDAASITDLHRENVDKITIPSQKGKGALKRVSEVFDCWFESGSMPYAHRHYPFENSKEFEAGFPGDFIAEGLDQTRGWFYTLMVLSTALFDKPAFKNLIVNGLVLAEDGKKMSKRLKNYPDPVYVINQYGADALRLYLINSPVVRAEPLRFKESGVRDVIKDVFLPWFNAYRFFVQNVQRFEAEFKQPFVPLLEKDKKMSAGEYNVMDQWILAATQTLLRDIHEEMKGYRLYNVVPKMLSFLDNLTNWYVRMNRPRLKSSEVQTAHTSLSTLFRVLLTSCYAMAPLTPFLTEHMYQNLKRLLPASQQEPSVHFAMIPEPDASFFGAEIETAVGTMISVIELGRNVRDRAKRSLKMPLREVVVITRNKNTQRDIQQLQEYIATELNVIEVKASDEEAKFVDLTVSPDPKALGRKLGKKLAAVTSALVALSASQVEQFHKSGSIIVEGEEIKIDEVSVVRKPKPGMEKYEAQSNGDVVVLLDVRQDAELLKMKAARELASRVQQLRKKLGLVVTDEIEVYYSAQDSAVHDFVRDQQASLRSVLRTPVSALASKPAYAVTIGEEDVELEVSTVEDAVASKAKIVLTRAAVHARDSFLTKFPAEFAAKLRGVICIRSYETLKRELVERGSSEVNIDGQVVAFKLDEDVVIGQQ
nr:isoleucyl-tRNA synthetase [Andalucia godoyi]|eukprot:ANDGO_07187.mRNA.1 Isoleucine--tRNA ligase